MFVPVVPVNVPASRVIVGAARVAPKTVHASNKRATIPALHSEDIPRDFWEGPPAQSIDGPFIKILGRGPVAQ